MRPVVFAAYLLLGVAGLVSLLDLASSHSWLKPVVGLFYAGSTVCFLIEIFKGFRRPRPA